MRDNGAQVDIDLYDFGLTLCVGGTSCIDFKQQVGGGSTVGLEQIRWPSCDASCCRSGLSFCPEATLPGAGERDRGLDMPLLRNSRGARARPCTMSYHAQPVWSISSFLSWVSKI